MRKVALVSGGAGFVGSHLCELLLERGFQVIAADNLVTGSEANIAHLLSVPGFHLEVADVCRPPLRSRMPGLSAVFHLASPASPSRFRTIPIEILDVNTQGTRNLLELAAANRARMLFASTSEVYGEPEVHPQPESYRGSVSTTGPRGCYDESKRCGEAYMMAYHRSRKVETRIVRIFNTYGPRMGLGDGRVIPNFLTQALRRRPLTVYGDGSQTRSLCYVKDLVAGIWTVFERGDELPYNLGNPHEMTMLELARAVLAATGSRSEISFAALPQDDPTRRRPDITRVRSLDWQPTVSLEEGLKLTLADFRARLKPSRRRTV